MQNNLINKTIDSELKTPVLLLIFNRPDTTQEVFNKIREAKPIRLFIAADGPRADRPDEKNKCEATRKIVSQVDWDCEVSTLFRDSNLGCKIAVSSAIDWFFEQVEEGIILEDDCVPHSSFFHFCSALLQKYRDDMRIMQVCGTNYFNGWSRYADSYYFSRYGPIWGWASWRRAWEYYDADMETWPQVKTRHQYEDFCDSPDEIAFRLRIYNKLWRGEIDTWDYQWGYSKMINSGLSVIPNINLISNIGFRVDGTHVGHSKSPFAEMQTHQLEFPLKHPKFVCRDTVSDRRYSKLHYASPRLPRINRFLRKYLFRRNDKYE